MLLLLQLAPAEQPTALALQFHGRARRRLSADRRGETVDRHLSATLRTVFHEQSPGQGAPIIAFVSLGTCQKIGLPMTSSAFFRLMPSSSDSAPTRLMTPRTC